MEFLLDPWKDKALAMLLGLLLDLRMGKQLDLLMVSLSDPW